MNSDYMIDADQEELKKAAVPILQQINPALQPYGKYFFEPLARLIVNIAIEPVFVRVHPVSLQQEILLRPRTAEETYPGQWHLPGSLLRYGEAVEDAFTRVHAEECPGIVVRKTECVGLYNNIKEARGHAVHIIYRCEVAYDGQPTIGLCSWFSTASLPDAIVDVHAEKVIPMTIQGQLVSGAYFLDHASI